MKTLTEFFRELVRENEKVLKESTENYKDADERLKCQLGSGVEDRVDAHMRTKYHNAKRINAKIKSIGYYKKMMVASKGLRMPCPTSDHARLYVGSDGHPMICKDFNFARKDAVLTNTVRIHAPFNLVQWADNRVSEMKWAYVRYLTRPRKSLAIPWELLQWMIKAADWWSAIKFCMVNVDVVYSAIKNNVGRYAGVDGHRNVVCGCAYDSKELQFVVSTARPHHLSWLRTIDLSEPVVFLQNTVYVPRLTSRYHYHPVRSEDDFDFSSVIHIGGHTSRTYVRGPKRFHKCAARSIHFGSSKPIKESWS